MGAANKVPGVSGGIVAFVAGFYEELIYSLQKINLKAFTILIRRGWSPFYQYTNGRFLVLLFSGVLISYFSVSLILDYLIKNFEMQVLGVFFGMILASLYFIYFQLEKWNFKTFLFFLIGLSIGIVIMLSKPSPENDDLMFVLFCGIISVSGMTLPGLSGSFLLLLLGNYTLLLVDAVNAIYYTLTDVIWLEFEFIEDHSRMKLLQLAFIFFVGSIAGLIMFSNVLNFVLKKFKHLTLATITGFIAGSLGVIWPWRNEVFMKDNLGEVLYNTFGNPIVEYYDYYLPDFFNTDFWFITLFIILGIFIVSLLEKYGVQKNKIKRYGLIGRNIAYSFSRGYFKQKFETENLEKCTYENFDLNEIQELNKILTKKNIYGLNVTTPFKREVVPFLDRLSPTAEKMNAVNTIKFHKDGTSVVIIRMYMDFKNHYWKSSVPHQKSIDPRNWRGFLCSSFCDEEIKYRVYLYF